MHIHIYSYIFAYFKWRMYFPGLDSDLRIKKELSLTSGLSISKIPSFLWLHISNIIKPQVFTVNHNEMEKVNWK